MGRYDSLGTDIVSHCANDVLAPPLLFLDYIGSGRLDPEAIAGIVRGAAEASSAWRSSAARRSQGHCGMGDFEIVSVCVVPAGRGSRRPGDAVLGLPSSGLHTNGYTLARNVLEGHRHLLLGSTRGYGSAVREVYLDARGVPAGVGLRKVADVGVWLATGGGLSGEPCARSAGAASMLVRGRSPRSSGSYAPLAACPRMRCAASSNLSVVVPAEGAEPGLEACRRCRLLCLAGVGEVVEGGGLT